MKGLKNWFSVYLSLILIGLAEWICAGIAGLICMYRDSSISWSIWGIGMGIITVMIIGVIFLMCKFIYRDLYKSAGVTSSKEERDVADTAKG